MEFHRLLKKQMKKYLKEDLFSDPGFNEFIRAVNESYHSFEKDKAPSLQHNNEYQENIQKRENAEVELEKQVELNKMLMNISSEYINISFEKISSAMNNSLKEIADFVQADRAYIFTYDFTANTCSNTYEYCAPGISPQIEELQNVPLDAIPEWVEAHTAGKSINIPDVNALEEGDLKDMLSDQGIKSLLVLPMLSKNKCVGFIGFDSVKGYRNYKETEAELLTLFAKVLVDAEERFFMESNLSRTLELLKTLIATLQYGILVEDENGKILFTNDVFCKMFNIHGSPEEIIGKNNRKFIEKFKHIFKEKNTLLRINQILEQKKIVNGELIETTDGRSLERDYIPIYIEEKLHGHLWKFNDATERLYNQNLLRQSEQRNRLIMDSAINAIITMDSTGEIIFWNQSAEVIFGWKKEEVIGKDIFEIIIPQKYRESYRNRVKAEKEAVLNKQIQLPAIRKSGEKFTMEISIISFEQQGKEFFCSFIQDISERKRAEHNLQVQEQKYRNMIANMNLGLLEVNINEVIQYANQSFCDVSGYDLDEIVGKNPAELFLHHEKDVEVVKEQVALRRSGVSSVYQVPVKNKAGELRWWAISGAPNFDDKGEMIGSIGIHLDITDQKRLEEDLKRQKEMAQEASKAKEAFLANMSHEIRTPLNAIIGFLRELGKQKLTSTQTKLMENCTYASQHLLSIINNILDISKIEAGEMSLEIKDFSLKESINNVINTLNPKAKLKKLKLYSAYSSDLASVFKGDKLKIEQILFNLVGNALKFTTQGEIKVECILLENKPHTQKIQLSVSDTGIGMNEDFINNIFKKFYQEDETISRRFGGTGLGMTITQELIKLMHGKITIESEKSIGTTIEIILTLRKGSEKNLTAKKIDLQNIPVEGTKVLLVEDNVLNRVVAQNTLQNFKCLVTETESGTEAIEILQKEKFDIILMDIQMPELDGIETTKILRNEFKLETPIVALTANVFKTEIEKCRDAGMNDYITKPFSEEILLEVLYKYTKTRSSESSDLAGTDLEITEDNLYDLASIRQLSRGNEDFVKKMVSIFITQTEETITLVHSHFKSKKYEEIAKLMHKIRPSIEGMGITSILDDVKLLEIKAKEDSPHYKELTALHSKIEKVLLSAIRVLKEHEL